MVGDRACVAGADTLQMVFIIARHGARLPMRTWAAGDADDLSWPNDKVSDDVRKKHVAMCGAI